MTVLSSTTISATIPTTASVRQRNGSGGGASVAAPVACIGRWGAVG